MSRWLDRAVEFLRLTDLSSLPDGRTEIESDRLYALCRSYATRPAAQCRWEAHRRYGDVQIVVAGAERIGWSPLSNMVTMTPYDAERDVEFFELTSADSGGGSHDRASVAPEQGLRARMPQWLTMTPGLAAVFFPHDAHQPEIIALKEPSPVHKVVIKFAVGL